ncbi:ABC transporter ATP-binding protein [Runella slithyformis]|uniref:ABC transporter related protein n=1 Tax=Runella slithyformis (strain ATCC 29530 / DSM 19594 / LMG 11500 / NCIMB 11436 / LSU 4) TaxID=761193 RepID=A0A7U4E626_RUNSL|nr:ATP-binding cassette domain-containing protein [Runella slithyformis]AEI48909.1 ABC transporter related protein [Runella slithyformis DSM 19594]
MQIIIDGLGKRFNREWIFRNFTLELNVGNSYTFVGPNGSGKSTLLQVISGVMPLTEGKITYQLSKKALDEDDWYRQIVLAAPYLELIEEFSLIELLNFHAGFKPFKAGITHDEILQRLELDSSKDKAIKYFSSGMKQRLKLALAFYSNVPVVMLDEPTSNLDAKWSAWYREEVQRLASDQLVLLCSNVPAEYDFCEKIINVGDYKPER